MKRGDSGVLLAVANHVVAGLCGHAADATNGLEGFPVWRVEPIGYHGINRPFHP